MKRFTSDQSGFGFVTILAVIALFGIIAFAGVRVMDNSKLDTTTATLSRTHSVPAKVQTTADLTKASEALDATPVDSGVNPSQLDKDLNSLL